MLKLKILVLLEAVSGGLGMQLRDMDRNDPDFMMLTRVQVELCALCIMLEEGVPPCPNCSGSGSVGNDPNGTSCLMCNG